MEIILLLSKCLVLCYELVIRILEIHPNLFLIKTPLFSNLINKPIFNHEQSIEEHQKQLANWGQSVHYLDQMLLILKERGELIIDEAHDGLLLKNKLNYTIGEPTFLNHDIVHASISFY